MYRRAVLFVALLLFGIPLASGSRAETISYADAITLLAEDCGSDIKRHCKGLNLGKGAIQNCLVSKASKVSASCTATLATVTQSIAQRQRAQFEYKKICRHSMAQRCKGMRGDGNILACLIKATRHVSDECNQIITDAGWR